jgi:2-hydroxychromene-2-carboxylate isomerase
MTVLFRFDTNSPYAYLAARRVDDVLGPGVRWQPIAFAFLLRAQQRTPWLLKEDAHVGQAEIERRAAERGLPPVRWPPGWPVQSYTLESLRAITAAGRHGLTRELALAVFRRNFETGEGLGGDGVRACWAEVGLDPAGYDEAIEAAKSPLEQTTRAAIDDGVPGVPTVTIAGQHFWGDDRLEDAAALRG